MRRNVPYTGFLYTVSMYLNLSFGYYVYNSREYGGEYHVCYEFPNEVPARADNDEIEYKGSSCRVEAEVCGVFREYLGDKEAENDEYPRVCDGRYSRADEHGGNTVLLFKKSVYRTAEEARGGGFGNAYERRHKGRVLEKDGRERIHAHDTALNKDYRAVDEAERRAVNEGNGDKHHVDVSTRDGYRTYHKVYYERERQKYGKIRHCDDGLMIFSCQHNKLSFTAVSQ